jgi:hypothetical protein
MTVIVPSDIEIAQAAKLRPIADVAAEVGLGPDEIIPIRPLQGQDPARRHRASRAHRAPGARHGHQPDAGRRGQVDLTVGLGAGPAAPGHKTMLCIREPSLGPVFGVKGGAAGGGYAQVVPMDDINLHFTGDFHAISSAHNLLLSAMLDNHIHQGNALGLDPRRITWPRTIDMNDRALRQIDHRAWAASTAEWSREERFVIVPGSEIMAIVPRDGAARTSSAAGRHHRGLHAAQTASRCAPRDLKARGCHDAAAQGRHPAQPGADARGRPGAGARRPLRQHRARLQLDDRHQAPGSRWATSCSPRPASAPTWAPRSSSTSSAASAGSSRRRRSRGHHPRAQDARRRQEGRARHRPTWRRCSAGW